VKLGLGGLRINRMKGGHHWKKEDIEKIKELIDEKTNEELAEMFNVTKFLMIKTIRSHNIKRSEESVRRMQSHKKEEHPYWKGGVSEDNYHYKKLQKERYPERVKARDTLRKAVEKGEVERKPCEFVLDDGNLCGDINSHGHHHDYSKPLDVKWLCRKHHRKVHGGTH
jgi:hypothetical protein